MLISNRRCADRNGFRSRGDQKRLLARVTFDDFGRDIRRGLQTECDGRAVKIAQEFLTGGIIGINDGESVFIQMRKNPAFCRALVGERSVKIQVIPT